MIEIGITKEINKKQTFMNRTFLSMMVLLAAGAASAQSEHGWSRWSVTPKAGLTVATHVGDDAMESSSSLAWAAGVEATYRAAKLVSYDLGLHYTRDRVKDCSRVHLSSWEYDLTLDDARLLTERIDMPLLVNLHVLPGLALKAGVQPSLLLSAKMKYHMTGSMVDFSNLVGKAYLAEEVAKMPRMAVDEDTSEGMKSQMRNLDVSVPVGLSYEWRNIVVDARYHFGLSRIAKDQDVHRRYVLLTLGYRFGL